jgi:hypothetical protein
LFSSTTRRDWSGTSGGGGKEIGSEPSFPPSLVPDFTMSSIFCGCGVSDADVFLDDDGVAFGLLLVCNDSDEVDECAELFWVPDKFRVDPSRTSSAADGSTTLLLHELLLGDAGVVVLG